MASPINPYKPSNIVVGAATLVSTAAAGSLIFYQAPAGKIAKIKFALITNFAGGAPTVVIRLEIGGNPFPLISGAAAIQFLGEIWLRAGDVLRLQCTAGAVGSTVDVYTCVEEYEAA
jgi:hypothetical protein